MLQDASAVRWLADRGLSSEPTPTVAVDEFSQQGVVLTRVWHTPARGRLAAPRGAVLLVLQLDASIEIGPEPSAIIAAGGSFVLASGQEVRVRMPLAGARIELTLPATGELTALGGDRVPAMVWASEERTWSRAALISLSNIVLNLGQTTALRDFDRFVTALHASAAAFVRTAHGPPVIEPWAHALVTRASLVIARRAGDPRFSVSGLAAELGVTSTHLSRAFREAGRPSPREVIREQRRTIATTLLERGDLARGRLDARSLARLSGFGSTDSLRRALRDG